MPTCVFEIMPADDVHAELKRLNEYGYTIRQIFPVVDNDLGDFAIFAQLQKTTNVGRAQQKAGR